MYQLEFVFRLLVCLQFPIQLLLKHRGAHKHSLYIHTYTHVIQNNLRTPKLADFAASWGVKIYIPIIYLKCLTMNIIKIL